MAEYNDFRLDASQYVATRIGNGTAPWQLTLAAGEASQRFEFPHNGTTGRAYRGGNGLLLMLQALAMGSADPRWFTGKQIRENGWGVRKGEPGSAVEYWETHEDREFTDRNSGGTRRERIPLAEPRAFYGVVYNANQIEGVPAYVPRQFPDNWDAHAEVERLVVGSGAKIVHEDRDEIIYDPVSDMIRAPAKESFADQGQYFEQLAHELGHWLGHPSRMNRPLSAEREGVLHAQEEFRAQLASLILSVELGLAFNPERHRQFEDQWRRVLTRDKHEFFRVARDAEVIAYEVLQLGNTRELVNGPNPQGDAQPTPSVESSQNPVPPVVPQEMTSSQKFEFERSNPREGMLDSLAATYAFGRFVGGGDEDNFLPFGRWYSELKDLMTTGSVQDIVAAMHVVIERGVPDEVNALIAVADMPGDEATESSVHEWMTRVNKRVHDARAYLDQLELRIQDGERVGVDEDVLTKARGDLEGFRDTLRSLESAPDKMLADLREKAAREYERSYSDENLQEFSKKPPVSTIEGWMTTQYEGREVFGTPLILDLSGTPPHMNGWEKRARMEADAEGDGKSIRNVSAASTASVVSGAVKRHVLIKLELIAGLDRKEMTAVRDRCAVFERVPDEPAIYVDPIHVRYFQSKFPGAEFHAPAAVSRMDSVLSVWHKGAVVGVLMPLHMGRTEPAKQIREFLQRNQLEAQANAAQVDGIETYVALDKKLLATKPTPASIRGWMSGEYEGKKVFMTADLMDLSGDPPAIKCWEQRVHEERPEVPASLFKRGISTSEGVDIKSIEAVAMVNEGKTTFVAFARNADDECVYLNSTYARYFESKYGEVDYRVGDLSYRTRGYPEARYPSIQVFSDEVLVGVVAPYSMGQDALTAAQLYERLGVKPAIKAPVQGVEAKAEVVQEKPENSTSRSAVDHVNGFTKSMPPVAANKLKKALGKELLLHGRMDTVRGHLERLHTQGDLCVARVQQNNVKPMTREAFNSASFSEQREHEQRVKAGGKATVYLVNNLDLGKVAHDYAEHLAKVGSLEKRAATDRPPNFEDVTSLAEIVVEMDDAIAVRDFQKHFGVSAEAFLKMDPIAKRQQLGNHFEQVSAAAKLGARNPGAGSPGMDERTAAVLKSLENRAERVLESADPEELLAFERDTGVSAAHFRSEMLAGNAAALQGAVRPESVQASLGSDEVEVSARDEKSEHGAVESSREIADEPGMRM